MTKRASVKKMSEAAEAKEMVRINKLFDDDTGGTKTKKSVSQQRVSQSSGVQNPYLVSSIFESIIKAIQMTRYKMVVIFVADSLKPAEIEGAVAVKDFFTENNIPCGIMMDRKLKNLKNFYPEFEKDFIYSLPCEDDEFIALALGVENRVDIVCKSIYRKAILTLSISCGKESTSNFAAKHVNDPSQQCSTSLIYPRLKQMAIEQHMVLSKKVKTEFLVAMYFALYGQREIYSSTIDMIRDLGNDGADYGEAEYQISKISENTLECTRLLLKRLHVSNQLAIAIIHQSDLQGLNDVPQKELRQSFDKAVHMFRNLETARVWIVYVEETDGAYYTILQTRRNTGYDMRKIAKKNNGIGSALFCRCIIFEMDLKKIQYDTRAYMKDFAEKQRLPAE